MFLQLCLPSCTHTAAGDFLLLPAPQDTALPPTLTGFPRSSTQPRLRNVAGPKLGVAHVDDDVGDIRTKKEQPSTSCSLWGHHCPHSGWLRLLTFWELDWKDPETRGCLNIAVPLVQEEWQSESEPSPQLLGTMREGTVQSALSALWRCPPFSISCQAPHLSCFVSCASMGSLYCGLVARLILAKKNTPSLFFCKLGFTSH